MTGFYRHPKILYSERISYFSNRDILENEGYGPDENNKRLLLGLSSLKKLGESVVAVMEHIYRTAIWHRIKRDS